MATLNDRVYDNGLSTVVSEANRVDICSSEPSTYTAATSTNSLGNKTSVTLTGPTNGDTSGRKITVPGISGGSVTSTGTATHYAVSDTVNSRLLITGALSSSQSVTSGNTFSLTAVDIELADPS